VQESWERAIRLAILSAAKFGAAAGDKLHMSATAKAASLVCSSKQWKDLLAEIIPRQGEWTEE
jgi:hypothetical protein